jgi:AcrR family transcriptional regulator
VDTDNVELRRRIVAHATPQFLRHGIRTVRTEDLAAELGISKKTIYRLFGSKDELLRQAVFEQLDRVDRQVTAIFEDRERPFTERLGRFLHVVGNMLSTISGSFVRDLNRYAPAVWDEIQEFRRRRVFSRFEGLLKEGIEEGTVRPEVEPHLLVEIFASIADTVITPHGLLALDVSPSAVLNQVGMLLSSGILTEEGRAALPAVEIPSGETGGGESRNGESTRGEFLKGASTI